MHRLIAASVLALIGLAEPARALCQASVDGLAFGVVNVANGGTTAGRIAVACDTATLFQVALASAATGPNRIMRNAQGAELRYDLFSQANMLIPWGDGAQLGPAVFARSNGQDPVELTVYGRLPPQNAPPGDYTDQIVVQVMF